MHTTDNIPRSHSDRPHDLDAAPLLRETPTLAQSRPLADTTAVRRTPDKLLRLPDVLRLTGLRRSSIYEQMKAGTFPQSVKLGRRAIAWSEAAVQAWIWERLNPASRIDGR